jgi:hypothetical protein
MLMVGSALSADRVRLAQAVPARCIAIPADAVPTAAADYVNELLRL